MGMRQEVIDIRGRSLEDRRKLRDFLLRLGEEIYNTKDPCGPYSPKNKWCSVIYSNSRYSNSSFWVGHLSAVPTITIEDFISKYSPTIKLSKIYRV
jgi:hypothetical protein